VRGSYGSIHRRLNGACEIFGSGLQHRAEELFLGQGVVGEDLDRAEFLGRPVERAAEARGVANVGSVSAGADSLIG
jgi:hypothetical protein